MLVDPRTLARHCLGPKPSHYVLCALDQEERKRKLPRHIRLYFLLFTCFNPLLFLGAEMTTKFNKEMYVKIKGKKNEPLSNIGQRRLRNTNKEKEQEKEMVERGLSTPTLDESQVVSPGISIEEVIPPSMKRKTGGKGKEKMGSSV